MSDRRLSPNLLAIGSMPAILLCTPAAAGAQETPPAPVTVSDNSLEPSVENGRQIYRVEQFERFAPQNALDLARQIPGFTISQVSSDRGFGEASQNVLINGQRITAKSNDAQTALSRIPLSSVVRLEVADASVFSIPGLNGLVLNAVVRDGGLKGNFTWRAIVRERVGINPWSGEASLSGRLGKGNFTLGLNNNGAALGGSWGEEFNRDANGTLLYTRQFETRNRAQAPRLSGLYNLEAGNGNILNINGVFELSRFRQTNTFDRITPGASDIFEVQRRRENREGYELGSDYEFALGKGRLKLIGFHRREDGPVENEFRRDFTDGTPSSGQRFDQVSAEGESVLRSEYRMKAGRSDWQVSLEGALNFLDARSEFFTLQNGEYVPQPLPGATSRVEERRGQAIIAYGRPLSGSLSLQASLGGEYSQISQTGPDGLTRSFWRPKGTLALTWTASPRLTVSSKLQRKVGQLSFGSFLAFVDVQNNNNNASNPQLVPPQSWLWENEANWLLGKAGFIKFKLDGELISDLVDQIPVSPTAEAVGNLSDTARRLRGEITGSFLFDTIGFIGARLNTTLALQTASVRDPLLLTHRPLSSRRRSYWNLDFRHDVPGTEWAWGVSAEDASDYDFYRLDYRSRYFRSGPFAFAYIEHKDLMGLRVRAAFTNLTRQREASFETFYADRRDGPVDLTREAEFNLGYSFRLTVSGTF
jgi:hypothetical protein